MRKKLLLFCLALFVLPSLCLAQGLQRKGEVTLKSAYNPEEMTDDVSLPMPCGAEMVFRVVAVPVGGYLSDLETRFGCDDCERSGEEFYDRQYSQGISGPFRLSDLPALWQEKLQAGRQGVKKANLSDKAIYFIAKYELSNLQWDVVMGSCPDKSKPLAADAACPKNGISWYDAVDFSRRYMDWLLAKQPGSLPRFSGDNKNVAFLRLPTEREWEYAARGGHMVSLESLRNENFFEHDKNIPLSDFAVYQTDAGSRAASGPENIGSRLPNPLGLYDMAGNVAEMVLDPFQFSLGGRLGGAAGGFVRKGGSFMTGEGEIMPGRREEVAFYVESGPNKARDLGFRLVLSGINTPGGGRPEALRREWKVAGTSSPFSFDASQSPLAEVDRLLSEAQNDREKSMLTALRGVIKDNNIALERQQEKAAAWHIRSAMHTVGSIRNFFIRRKTLSNQMQAMQTQLGKTSEQAQKEKLKKSIGEHKEFIAMLDQAIDTTVGHYRILVEESAIYPKEMFDKQLALAREEIKGNDWNNKELQSCFEKFDHHIKLLRQNKKSQLSVNSLRKDMVSAEYQK